MSGRSLRVGVAGLGFGVAVHVPGFRGISGVEVVALAGRNRARAAAIATALGIPTACASIEELLALPLDAVSIALPPAENERAVRLAIERRIPVLVEKPVAGTARAAAMLADAARGHTVSAVDYELAELSAFRALHDVVAQGSYGEVRQIDLLWRLESRAHREHVWSWKTDAEQHGGVLTLLGSHVLYLLEWIFGPVHTVSAVLRAEATSRFAPAGAISAEDWAQVTLEHVGGAKSTVTLSNASPGIAEHRWTVACAAGTLVLEDHVGGTGVVFSLRMHTRDGAIHELVPVGAAGTEDWRIPPFRSLAARFVEAIRSGGDAAPALDAGARVQLLIDVVRVAATSGSAISPHQPYSGSPVCV